MERILHLDIVDSTNEKLKELAMAGAPEGQAVIAEEQTAGKGRRGRSFCSPKGKGIYLSYLFRPKEMTEELSFLTAWTAVAVRNVLERMCGVNAGIKWVNDLVLHRKKLCGILTEMAMEGGGIQYVIVGIGINVNEELEDFEENVREVATSLRIETGKVFSKERIVDELLQELDEMRDLFFSAEGKKMDGKLYLKTYREACVTIGKDVTVIIGNLKKSARALAINEDFTLSVEYEDGTRENLSGGEVSVRGLEGYV